ncbi:MAG: hypothetical protein GC193_08790 [Cryomorphaceae bacterium]|nr:hypothetical protein [Cryomorphaceae bacterium]
MVAVMSLFSCKHEKENAIKQNNFTEEEINKVVLQNRQIDLRTFCGIVRGLHVESNSNEIEFDIWGRCSESPPSPIVRNGIGGEYCVVYISDFQALFNGQEYGIGVESEIYQHLSNHCLGKSILIHKDNWRELNDVYLFLDQLARTQEEIKIVLVYESSDSHHFQEEELIQ